MWDVRWVPSRTPVLFCVGKQDVVSAGKSSKSVAFRVRPTPDDFISEILWSKHRVHQHLQIVTRRAITVQINRSGYLQDALELDQTRGHHGQISHHVAVAEEGAEGAHGFGYAAASLDNLLVGALRVRVPLPCIFEGHDLRGGTLAALLGKQDVVVLAAVERRVEVDEVDG